MTLALLFDRWLDDDVPTTPRLYRPQNGDAEGESRARGDDGSADGAVWTRIRAGDEVAFETLFQTLWEPLTMYAARLLRSSDRAVDVVQDVFAQLWEQRTTLSIRDTLRGYLYTTVRHRALSALRHDQVVLRAHGEVEDPLAWSGKVIAPGPDPLIDQERLRALRNALTALPQRGREVVVLRWFHALSHAEVAATLGISKETVHVHLTRAMASLRRALTSQ